MKLSHKEELSKGSFDLNSPSLSPSIVVFLPPISGGWVENINVSYG